MTNQDILKSLPLLASVLGRQHGVQVTVGGKTAYTNGRTVNIPALPLDAGSEVLGMVRGYIDHEAGGHLRFTNFDALWGQALNPVEKFAWNAIEDWRVEKALSDIYPGCRANLEWLVRKIFVDEFKPSQDPETAVMSYILLTCRAWSVPEVEARRQTERQTVVQHYPQLLGKLDALLAQVRANCPDTQTAIAYAKLIARLIDGHSEPRQARQAQEAGNTQQEEQAAEHMQELGEADQTQEATHQDDKDPPASNQEQCEPLRITEENLPKSFSEQLADRIGSVNAQTPAERQVQVALPVRKKFAPLPEDEQRKALAATTGLRYRLQGMLQAMRMRDTAPSRHGRLCPHNLHRVFVDNPKVFRSNAPTPAVNTAVHILCDCSGSMIGMPIEHAREACFAIAYALKSVPGINLGITAFPAEGKDFSVVPVLEHGKPFHANFLLSATGSTPLTEALLWTAQELCKQPEPRKILILLSDGGPDNQLTCVQAIADTSRFVELYGIGIWDDSIVKLLPDTSAAIYDLGDLNTTLFRMLQNSLLPRR